MILPPNQRLDDLVVSLLVEPILQRLAGRTLRAEYLAIRYT